MQKRWITGILILGMGIMVATAAEAIPTSLTVRVLAHDAKFVGSGVGDVQVTVRDFVNHEIVASGFVTGDTGDTKILMETPRERTTKLSDTDSAVYTATLNIETPQKLLVEVDGPLSAGIDAHHESMTTWLIPGKNIDGDGLLFEFYGLIVRNYHPTPHEFVKAGKSTVIGAHVTMMCGCPITPESLWKSGAFTITALVVKDGKKVAEMPLKYAGRISDFEAQYTFKEPGTYRIITLASDDKNNQGVDTTSYAVTP
jgi:hypothetical protein